MSIYCDNSHVKLLTLGLQHVSTQINNSDLDQKKEKLEILRSVLLVTENDWERIGEERGKQITLMGRWNISYPGQTTAPHTNMCQWWFKNGSDMKQRIIKWVEATKNKNEDSNLTLQYDWKKNVGQGGTYTSQTYSDFKSKSVFKTHVYLK